jgi:hypothetical protein
VKIDYWFWQRQHLLHCGMQLVKVPSYIAGKEILGSVLQPLSA